MTIGKNILKAQRITFPQYYAELPLKDLTYKWDNVPVNDWVDYAEEKGIPYKQLFSDMDQRGLLNPVIVRDLKANGIYRKFHCGGRRIIWAKRNGYDYISAYIVKDWISEEGRKEIDTIVADQWFQID